MGRPKKYIDRSLTPAERKYASRRHRRQDRMVLDLGIVLATLREAANNLDAGDAFEAGGWLPGEGIRAIAVVRQERRERDRWEPIAAWVRDIPIYRRVPSRKFSQRAPNWADYRPWWVQRLSKQRRQERDWSLLLGFRSEDPFWDYIAEQYAFGKNMQARPFRWASKVRLFDRESREARAAFYLALFEHERRRAPGRGVQSAFWVESRQRWTTERFDRDPGGMRGLDAVRNSRLGEGPTGDEDVDDRKLARPLDGNPTVIEVFADGSFAVHRKDGPRNHARMRRSFPVVSWARANSGANIYDRARLGYRQPSPGWAAGQPARWSAPQLVGDFWFKAPVILGRCQDAPYGAMEHSPDRGGYRAATAHGNAIA